MPKPAGICIHGTCNAPAAWISNKTGNPFCDGHKRLIEGINPESEGGPGFRPFDAHDAGAAADAR